MTIYVDQDYKFFLIEEIGIFEWKEFDDNTKRRKKTKFVKEEIDKTSLYNRLVVEANNQDKSVSQLLIEDVQSKIRKEIEEKSKFYDDSLLMNDLPKLSISKLFNLIQSLKKIRGSAMSDLMKEINVGSEGNLLVLSSSNKNLITLFINKIATMGIFPINQMVVNESNNTLVYKYYYDSDNEDGENFFDDDF